MVGSISHGQNDSQGQHFCSWCCYNQKKKTSVGICWDLKRLFFGWLCDRPKARDWLEGRLGDWSKSLARHVKSPGKWWFDVICSQKSNQVPKQTWLFTVVFHAITGTTAPSPSCSTVVTGPVGKATRRISHCSLLRLVKSMIYPHPMESRQSAGFPQWNGMNGWCEPGSSLELYEVIHS